MKSGETGLKTQHEIAFICCLPLLKLITSLLFVCKFHLVSMVVLAAWIQVTQVQASGLVQRRNVSKSCVHAL